MKQTLRTVALFFVLSLAATSCQKEPYVEPLSPGESIALHTVAYTIDGTEYRTTFTDDTSWRAFLEWMVAKAEEGHHVSFRNEAFAQNSITKDVVIHTTKDKKDATDWAYQMEKEGYAVSVNYDEKTGIYTCTAVK